MHILPTPPEQIAQVDAGSVGVDLVRPGRQAVVAAQLAAIGRSVVDRHDAAGLAALGATADPARDLPPEGGGSGGNGSPPPPTIPNPTRDRLNEQLGGATSHLYFRIREPYYWHILDWIAANLANLTALDGRPLSDYLTADQVRLLKHEFSNGRDALEGIERAMGWLRASPRRTAIAR